MSAQWSASYRELPNWADRIPPQEWEERYYTLFDDCGGDNCNTSSPDHRYVCTRPVGHEGRHVAHYGEADNEWICAWWDDRALDGHDILRALIEGRELR